MIIDMPTVSMGTNGSIITADRVSYDNATSGLEAENLQDAVDEIGSKITSLGTITKADFPAGYFQKIYTQQNTPLVLNKGKYLIVFIVAWNTYLTDAQSFFLWQDGGENYYGYTGTNYAFAGSNRLNYVCIADVYKDNVTLQCAGGVLGLYADETRGSVVAIKVAD